MNFGDDITSQLRLAKKHHFTKQEEKRIAQEIELQVYININQFKSCFLFCNINVFVQMYLNRLIREDRDRQIERISNGKEYSQVENEVSDVEMTAVIQISCY